MSAADPVLGARRRIRSIRIRDAIGQDPSVESESRYRDQLLGHLTGLVATAQAADVDEGVVDAAVSVSLAAVDEDRLDSLSALLVSAQLLAMDSQFARLRQLAPRFSEIGSQLQGERPYLSVTLRAITEVLQGRGRLAIGSLSLALGLSDRDDALPTRVPRTWESIADVLIAGAFRRWLIDGSRERLEQSKRIGLDRGDGLLLALTEFLLSYGRSAASQSIEAVVSAADSSFRSDVVRRYLAGRGITTLFPAQTFAINRGVLSSGSYLVAMPTSSGKTFLAELRILAELKRNPSGRVIYLTPYRLLARQVEIDLSNGLRSSQITVRDLGSAYDLSLEEQFLVGDLPDIAIMTPERLDALVRLSDSDRRGNEAAADLISSVVLLVMDEIQLVGRSGRGSRLELLFTRLRQRMPNAAVLALAAASEGVAELAEWLDATPIVYSRGRPTGSIELVWKAEGSIHQRFEGRPSKVGTLVRAKSAIDAAADLAFQVRHQFSPVLVVETTRDYAESVIRKVSRVSSRSAHRWRDFLTPNQRNHLDQVADLAAGILGEHNELPDLIRQGLAYHHAGVPPQVLRSIEDLVRNKALRVMGATTTVAEGAHLPFQVVIIPHLNFGGSGSRLGKDLYQNIVGRAGRANVAVEGFIIVLDSESKSLRNYVENVLWSDDYPVQISSQLLSTLQPPRNLEQNRSQREFRSQIVAWLGDPNSYREDQSRALANETFAWSAGATWEKESLEVGIAQTFRDFEDSHLAMAASPYQLTPLGRRVRLAGVGLKSCLRISNLAQELNLEETLQDLRGRVELTPEIADLIGRLVFETEEVLERSLWFQKLGLGLNPEDQVAALNDLTAGGQPWPYEDPLLQVDLEMFSGWLRGLDFTVLGSLPPILRQRGPFSNDDLGKRASDAAEQMGRLAYPAAWAWSAVGALIGEEGDNLPGWIRRAIEFGVPSESAVEFVRTMNASRGGAVLLSQNLSPRWDIAEAMLMDVSVLDLQEIGLARADIRAVLPLRDGGTPLSSD